MPPHISEIVKRKPHLVEQILKQHRSSSEGQQAPSSSPAIIRPTIQHDAEKEAAIGRRRQASGFGLSSLVSGAVRSTSGGNQTSALLHMSEEYEGDDFDEDQNDGETTGLLLRHRHRGGSNANHFDDDDGGAPKFYRSTS
uniref:Uncharacterized protein n=2 Tax=Entomoneis paludosa TaxID=265537 RepID=A0A7S3DN54_9STRA|mmetsp:Transcript_22279/g.46459  ORF Transcript_22279/g.46459 Transcript_22279/m.46459 type:complete len:140 (+) Transcript_22279:22-441(+)